MLALGVATRRGYLPQARLHEASDLLEAVRAATKGFLEQKRTDLTAALATRREVME